jgi:hypothetical protein
MLCCIISMCFCRVFAVWKWIKAILAVPLDVVRRNRMYTRHAGIEYGVIILLILRYFV